MTEPNDTPIDDSWEEMTEARKRPRTPQHALLIAVRAGEMTPKQVDEKSLADGLPLRHDGWQDLHDITANSIWWLQQTILFYAWRDLTRTREQWERFRVWEADLWRDPVDERQLMTLDEAEAMFRSDLSTGIVRAFGAIDHGPVRPIPCEAWDELRIHRKRTSAAIGSNGLPRFTGVFVLRHEVVPMLIAEQAGTTLVPAVEPEMRGRPDQPAPKRAGGAPERYDWEGMWIEVVRLARDGELPSRAKLPDHIAKWFQATTGDEPGSATIRAKVRRLFDTIGIE